MPGLRQHAASGVQKDGLQDRRACQGTQDLVMTFHWHHDRRDSIEILSLSGHAGLTVPDLIIATVAERLTHGDRLLVIDLTEMAGWGHVGRTAVVEAVRHLSAHRRVMVCPPRDKLTLWALRESDLTIEMCPDVDTARSRAEQQQPAAKEG
ncbi:hypothetical protein [Nonomuraea sp. 10N515B]|uniref:hypothetical protein n=1 Tax=Nonomuraea sp. 10N515B TaxID=3457422 RepID=UPI003FCD7FD3